VQKFLLGQMDSGLVHQLSSRLKDLEYDNFRLERKLQETLSRQWRIETIFSNYLFTAAIREKYEQSRYYCQGEEGSANSSRDCTRTGKTYFVHFVDYLGSNAFRRIQDALDIANDFDKVVVAPGVYNEALIINKQVILISNGYVEIRSGQSNVITCCAPNEGCLIKGFVIRRLDSNKIDPTSCGVNGAATSGLNTEKSLTNVSERDMREPRRPQEDEGSKGGGRVHTSENKFGIYVKEGRATVEECDMLSECGTVVFCNPRSHTKLVRNVICGSVGSGVMVTGKGARILAEDNHIFGSTGCGIDVRNNASCTLVKNRIHNCDKSGIYVLMTNDARIFRNEIWENHFSGIEVTNA